MSQTVAVSAIQPIERDEAMSLAETEYTRFIELLRALSPEQWSTPTDCPGWDVRTVASHVLGSAEAHASLRELAHQYRGAKKSDTNFVDGLTATQVRDRAALSPIDVIVRLERAAPASVRARRRTPGFIRSRTMLVDMPGVQERWPLSYLFDVIFTRDTWMHRVDVARATSHELVLTHEHDGRILADVVAEWSRRHGKPFRLTLTGPAGGTFTAGVDGEELELDAVAFCRVLAGRAPDAQTGLLAQQVPF
jgi:uncharacterized protein (TIGR03083 family)